MKNMIRFTPVHIEGKTRILVEILDLNFNTVYEGYMSLEEYKQATEEHKYCEIVKITDSSYC